MPEPDVSTLPSVEEAIAIIDATAVHPRIVRVALSDSQGLYLAQDLVADRDYPPFDKSQMDGFAVRLADTGADADLRIVGEIAAGQWPTHPLNAGETVAIMTGAPIPPGADAVAPVKHVQKQGNVLHVPRGAADSRYIARQGQDIRAGAVVLHRGVCMQAAQLAAAATVGAAQIDAFDRPRVAVLSTGDELVPIDSTPQPAQIRNSNNVMLVALLRRLGCAVDDLGTVVDQKDKIRAALSQGLQRDALFVTGGMSMGEYDFVPRLLAELNVDLKITKIRIKPGKPFVFGTHKNAFVFGLPGNPVSAFTCAVRFATRILARIAGSHPHERWVNAVLDAPLSSNGPREFYQPVRLVYLNGAVHAQLLEYKGSADLFSLAAANALMVRPANDPAQPVGHMVRALEI